MGGCSDGITENHADSQPPCAASGQSSLDASSVAHHGAARVALARLLAGPPEFWKEELVKLPTATLDAILGHLRQKKAPRGANAIANRPKATVECNVKCIRRDKAGYTVKVQWASLSISTGYTQSLDQAIDWHIALTRVKGIAQRRLQERTSVDNDDPLTNDELLQVLELAPTIQLSSFSVSFKRAGKLVYTPTTQDLGLAMEFRRRYLAILGREDFFQHLEHEKGDMVREVKEQKRQKRTCEGILSKSIVAVIASRSGLLAALKPSSSCPTLNARLTLPKVQAIKPFALAPPKAEVVIINLEN